MGFLASLVAAMPRVGVRSWLAAMVVGASLLAPASVPIARADDQPITKDDFVKGTIDINFETRTNKDQSGDLAKDSAAKDAKDHYKLNLTVAETSVFTGEIIRQPDLYSRILKRSKQPAQLFFNINLAVLNPKDLSQKKDVGKWVGTVPIKDGRYDLAGGKALEQSSALRVSIDQVGAQSAFTDNFGGNLVGKAEKKDNLASYTYKRVIGGKEQSITVKKVDPMKFENVELGKGPFEIYPHCLVNGHLDFDYETGNWLTDGVSFQYGLDGKDVTDKLTGSIKWVEDSQRATNGKGYYEFNLRFNEDKNKPAAGENAAFEKMSAEDAFFAVDTAVPSLTGKIEYVDTFIGGDKDKVASSKVIYHLNANKLTKQQVMNFVKLWLLAVGPTNDE